MEKRIRRAVAVLVVTLGSATLMSTTALPASADQAECTGSATSAQYHHLVVPGGETCVLRESTVTGNIRVLPGGTLVAEASTIGGSIIGHDVNRIMVGRTEVAGSVIVVGGAPSGPPPVALSMCATSVAGNVIIQQVTGGIGVRPYIPGFDPAGGMAARCGAARNEIGGNLIVSNNISFRMLVQDNDVRGNLVVVHNTGAGPKSFIGNSIDGNLVCAENEQPLTVSGNEAGQVVGQCAG